MRTMDEHFADLFARYARQMAPAAAVQSTPTAAGLGFFLTEVALARAALRGT